MLIIRPRRLTGVAFGGAVVLTLLVASAGLVLRVAAEPPGLTSFTAGAVVAILLASAAAFGYWTYGCWSLFYGLDRNALTIAWAGNSYQIPLKDVTALVPAERESAPRGLGGLWWPGHRIGGAITAAPSLPDTVLFFGTERDGPELTYVVTPRRGYAISPPDPAAFAEELKLRARLGPTQEVPHEAVRWWPWDLPAWHDWYMLGAGALGLGLNIALFAWLALMMPALPDVVPMHLSPVGIVDRLGSKTELFALPAAGLALQVTNVIVSAFLHRVERLAGYLTIAAGAAVQALLWGAWLRLLG